MDGKQFFRQCCRKYGIECDKYFQLGASSAKTSDRFYHRFNPKTITETQLFAVCYFVADDLYLAWKLHNPLKPLRYCFSLKKSDMALSFTSKIGTVPKIVDHSGVGKETVIAFAPEAVPAFFEQYIPKD